MTIRFGDRVFSEASFVSQEPGACGLSTATNYLRLFDIRIEDAEMPKVHEDIFGKPIDPMVGIDEVGIAELLTKFNLTVKDYRDVDFGKAAMRAPSIICVDNWNHWVVLFDSKTIIDPDSTKERIYNIGWVDLNRRWLTNGIYYSITTV